MSSQRFTDAPVQNQILASLPREEYLRLISRMTLVHLPRGKFLYHAGDPLRHAYFLNTGMVSLLSMTTDGASVEIGMVGNEGVAGITVILGRQVAVYEMNVQIEVESAWKISAEALKEEFSRGDKLQEVLLTYTHVMLAQIAQSALCNRFHTAEQRLGRWLLVARDRVNSNSFNLTHESIAQMLGTPRTGVTMIAGHLQRQGLISYRRGKIEILDPEGLEEIACECYRMTKENLYDFTNSRSMVA